MVGRTEAHAKAAEAAFRSAGAEAVGVVADLLRDGSIEAVVARAREVFDAVPAAVVWNVGFVPWPVGEGWDPALLARVARDEARALGSLAAALAPHWRGAGGLIVTIEGHSQERIGGLAPALAVASAVRAAIFDRLRLDAPELTLSRVVLGAIPSGPAGEGRWLTQDEVTAAVAEALVSRAARIAVGDLELAAQLADRFKAPR